MHTVLVYNQKQYVNFGLIPNLIMAVILSGIYFNYSRVQKKYIVAFFGFFQVASLFSTRVERKKVGVDNEKAGQQKIFFSYFSLISMKKYNRQMQ